MIDECEFCKAKLSKELMKAMNEISVDSDPCFCTLGKKWLRLKSKIKKQDREITMLNKLLQGAQPESWDLDAIYEGALSGIDEYTGDSVEPDKDFAKWIKERWNL